MTWDTRWATETGRDTMDRDYAKPLDVAALARVAHVSPVHFIRTFRATFGKPRIVACNAGEWSGPATSSASRRRRTGGGRADLFRHGLDAAEELTGTMDEALDFYVGK
ncbi:hypothetical protein AB0C38_25345 [Amycolatopsis sp. NPDC048633]|uniref:hypothetical protein n=1 Tax=Amycolatopsis sp. NPDC048633 TaxID=3157095 RepID=UPI0034115DCE